MISYASASARTVSWSAVAARGEILRASLDTRSVDSQRPFGRSATQLVIPLIECNSAFVDNLGNESPARNSGVRHESSIDGRAFANNYQLR